MFFLKIRIRHIQRYREIVVALSRNGFGLFAKELGLLDLISFPKQFSAEEQQEIHTKTKANRIRSFLEELGPTFIKIGQIASTRPDLIPADIIHELEKLQDKVLPFSYQNVKQIIEEELNQSIDDIFEDFHEVPLAAASIGQVHYGVLKSGEQVAIKIQRPNIEKIIETDLEILQNLAELAEHRFEWAARYRIRDIIEDFSKSLQAELNYTIEGRNAEKVANQFKHNPQVLVPEIYWSHSTSKVLTMEYIEGTKLNELKKLDAVGLDCKVLAERVVQAIFHQILIEGFFHGDPHPGNILSLPGEIIVFMDFGMVGSLSPDLKYHLASLVISMKRQNTSGVIKAITQMGLIPDDVNIKQLTSDVDDLKQNYYDVPLSQVSLGTALHELFTIAYKHHIQIPSDLTLLGKTLLTIEGVVEKLDPELSIIKLAEPFGRQLLKERYHPKKVAENVIDYVMENGEILIQLPKQFKELISVMKNGKIRMAITIPELNLFLTKLDRISNRLSFSIVLLSFSIIMAGLIMGSALSRKSTLLWNLPAIEIGFGIAILMFFWLIYSIFKSGRF